MSIVSKGMIAVSVIFSILLLAWAVYAVVVFSSVGRFAEYWSDGNRQPISDNNIVLVALGDSTVQGIGATSPTKGFVGQVAGRLALETNRPVQVYNFSKSGAVASDVAANQLAQKAIIDRADLVLVAVGPNDLSNGVPREEYLKSYQSVLDKLPKDRVVIASIPPLVRSNVRPGMVQDWNQGLEKLALDNKVQVAPVYEVIKRHQYDPRIYSVDLFHPSNHGYGFWADAFYQPVQTLEFPGVIQ